MDIFGTPGSAGCAIYWDGSYGAVTFDMINPIEFVGGIKPLNPRGRTGLAGRGCLDYWGPNHVCEPIITRFHPRGDRGGAALLLGLLLLLGIGFGVFCYQKKRGGKYGIGKQATAEVEVPKV